MLQNRNVLSCWTLSWSTNTKTLLKMFLPVICLFLILMDGAYGHGFGSCPKHSLMKNVNFTQLKGEWVGYGRTNGLIDPPPDCMKLRFDPGVKRLLYLHMWTINSRTREPGYSEGSVIQETNQSPIVFFEVNKRYGGKYQILYTDYTNITILWHCSSWGWLCYFDVIWVLARENQNVRNQVNAELKKFHLDPSRLYLGVDLCK